MEGWIQRFWMMVRRLRRKELFHKTLYLDDLFLEMIFMPKKLRDEPIYLAPDILAWRDAQWNPIISDERENRELNPNSISDKVYIYERQVNEWFISRANSLIQRKRNDFVVLMIAVAYIEGSEQYRRGQSSQGQSKKFFRYGVQRIFGFQEDMSYNIDTLYTHLRCGLFHNGMSGDAVVLSRKFKTAVSFPNRGTVDINPRLFLKAVVEDFRSYIVQLQDETCTELRAKFDRMFFVI